jgi:hypothetical protein
MLKRKNKSSKAPNKPSRATTPAKAPASSPQPLPSAAEWNQAIRDGDQEKIAALVRRGRAAEWEQAVRDGDQEKIAALGRRDPNDPNDVPEKDTYVPLPDDFPKPALTVTWTDEQLGKWLLFGGNLRAYFAAESAAGRGRPYSKWTDRVAYIKTLSAPADCTVRKVPGNTAETLATACWDKSWGKDEADK